MKRGFSGYRDFRTAHLLFFFLGSKSHFILFTLSLEDRALHFTEKTLHVCWFMPGCFLFTLNDFKVIQVGFFLFVCLSQAQDWQDLRSCCTNFTMGIRVALCLFNRILWHLFSLFFAVFRDGEVGI